MAEMNYNDIGVAAALGQLAQAQEAMAMRPQKTYSRTTTSSTSTPRALEDMIMRRGMIGANNQRLLDALKKRETFGYNFGSGLANLAPVSGYGDWGVNALRAFGGAMTRPTDAEIAREQAARQMEAEDIKTALDLDKAMGETQNQIQEENVGYTEMPYSGIGAKSSQASGGELDTGGGSSGGVVLTGGVSKNYDPVVALTKSSESFGPLARLEDRLDKLGIVGQAINATGVTKALKDKDTRIIRNTLADDLSRLNAAKSLELVKGAGSVRIADSDEEKKELYGPLKDALATKDDKEIAAVLAATRRRAYSIYLQKAHKQVESGAMSQQDVASQDEFDTWWNSFWINPTDIKQAMSGGAPSQPALKRTEQGPVGAMTQNMQSTQRKNTVKVGETVNGFRFKGGNPNDKNSWEKVQ